MLIGRDKGETKISHATVDAIKVRGHDLCRDLIGRTSFTGYFHLLVTGRPATPKEEAFLDAVLVAIAEHGLVPNVVACRMTYASDPTALQAAVAAGILGCGGVVLGTSQTAGNLLSAGLARITGTGDAVDAVAAETVAGYVSRRERLPGFGHPLHKPVDPRTVRLFDYADEEGVSGPAIAYARALDAAVQAGPRPLPLNVSMAIPAILLDIGFPLSVMRGIPLLARTAGLIAHLAEESATPIGFLMAHHAETAIPFTG